MLLSVIIVNYNVRHFLEQCLFSVQEALKKVDGEAIVVDNNSTDGSLPYLEPKFSGVLFLNNPENIGFAAACNQGLQQAAGKYILFLNPDTIVPEDCFEKCIAFMQAHPEAGALGVKMMDGSGQFLKESKRAFPGPLTSLYKLFGFARLFPKSKTFARYHLGHLDENAINEVDVLAGAFMMVSKETLQKTGNFDETFFMYGEDVDLSYRIQQAGFKNYYFPETPVIHFKGESTRKGSMNYVRMFYKAMSIFVKKHYGGSKAGIFNFLIHIAIWFRAGLTAIANFIRRVGLPVIDAGLIFLSFWLVKIIWETRIKPDINYQESLIWVAFPVYTVVFLIAAYYAGLYDKNYKISELIRSSLIATIVLLAGYSLLPEQYRFSRGILLFGSILAFLLIGILRWILVKAKVLEDGHEKRNNAGIVIAGTENEFNEAKQILTDAGLKEKIVGRISPNGNDTDTLGNLDAINKTAATLPVKELIYCQGRLSFSAIINSLQKLPAGIIARIHAAGSASIVGSMSKNSLGDTFSKENGFRISDPYNVRIKRLIDFSAALIFLLTFPVHIFLVKRPFRFLASCVAVLAAKKTWVGYAGGAKGLPALRPPVMASNGLPLTSVQAFSAESLQMIDYWYARDYEPRVDLKLIRKSYRSLGG